MSKLTTIVDVANEGQVAALPLITPCNTIQLTQIWVF